jgi:hypothetical protein
VLGHGQGKFSILRAASSEPAVRMDAGGVTLAAPAGNRTASLTSLERLQRLKLTDLKAMIRKRLERR